VPPQKIASMNCSPHWHENPQGVQQEKHVFVVVEKGDLNIKNITTKTKKNYTFLSVAAYLFRFWISNLSGHAK